MTKTEMAQQIVKALFNVEHTPAEDNVNVRRISRKRKDSLIEMHKSAIKIIEKQEMDREYSALLNDH